MRPSIASSRPAGPQGRRRPPKSPSRTGSGFELDERQPSLPQYDQLTSEQRQRQQSSLLAGSGTSLDEVSVDDLFANMQKSYTAAAQSQKRQAEQQSSNPWSGQPSRTQPEFYGHSQPPSLSASGEDPFPSPRAMSTAGGVPPPRAPTVPPPRAPSGNPFSRGPSQSTASSYPLGPPRPASDSIPEGPPSLVRRATSAVFPEHTPYFCILAFLGNAAVFVLEIKTNGWKFQPFSCPATCADGSPCFEDGRSCEANPLLGPTVAVLDQLGAKNDVAIFQRGEWWRIATCNWMHAGLLHLLFNMLAVWRIGSDLERAFGHWRVGLLWIFAGLFGTVVSIIFLPGLLSVGASASVFGLVGACWADVIVNFCARGTLKNSGIACLTLATLLNVSVGFTPWVDNFMHLGGMVAGLFVGLAAFARKARNQRTGEKGHTRSQEVLVFLAVFVLFLMTVGACACLAFPDLQDWFRTCPFCKHLNCIPTPWWNCCLTALPGQCAILPPPNATAPIHASCNMTTGEAPFSASCSPLDNSACVYDSSQLQELCALICMGGC